MSHSGPTTTPGGQNLPPWRPQRKKEEEARNAIFSLFLFLDQSDFFFFSSSSSSSATPTQGKRGAGFAKDKIWTIKIIHLFIEGIWANVNFTKWMQNFFVFFAAVGGSEVHHRLDWNGTGVSVCELPSVLSLWTIHAFWKRRRMGRKGEKGRTGGAGIGGILGAHRWTLFLR